ncbi:MAG TPA: site-2 protease family protein [candidate division Zixibacteria bacterium]|nr:site-2 protease family protein [candidate division Zixibacteria bacterium]
MPELTADKRYRRITGLLADLFEVSAYYIRGNDIVFSLSTYYERDKAVELLRDRLKLAGYTYSLDDCDNQLTLTVDPKRKISVPPLNIILFLITLASVYFVPVFFRQLSVVSFTDAFGRTLTALKQGQGIEFTLALISILFVHEMGHFIASRRRNIITSFPYFIPAPNIIGTFGAIIKSKTPFWNRRDLIEVGAAGPIAGWIVAVACLVYGLTKSVFLHPALMPAGAMGFSLQGESILMRVLTLTIVGHAPDGYAYVLSESAFAGWVGLLVTAINLLPIGQLDGGHILFGLFRQKQYALGYAAMGLLFLLGFQSPIWWVFAVFGLVFKVKHPPTLDDSRPPGIVATGMGITALVILVLSFTPVPFR